MKKRNINPEPLGGDALPGPPANEEGPAPPHLAPPSGLSAGTGGSEGPANGPAFLPPEGPPPPPVQAWSGPEAPVPDHLPLPPPPAGPFADSVFAPALASADPPRNAAPLSADLPGPLEERVRRLEDALAQLVDLKGIETRVAERVAERLERDRKASPRSSPPPAGAIQAPLASPAAVLVDVGQRLLAAAPQAVPARPPGPPQQTWLLAELLAEARAIVRMYVDPRYSMPWLGRLLPLALLAAFITSYYWAPFTSVPVVGWLLNKVLDLVLGFVLFKVLGHEARRYRETAPDLPPNLRL